MPDFTLRTDVMFQHCDPAGIVFYPRYFEMINEVVERFFERAVGWSFSRMHIEERLGVPMGRISAEFHAPSRLGDALDWRLAVGRFGRSSAELAITAACSGQARLDARATLVLVDLDAMRAHPWPDPVRGVLNRHMEAAE